MAAYAAILSLMKNMDPESSVPSHKKQIESLGEKVRFLLDFIENYNAHAGNKEAEDLESQITSAAHGAEDVIESHVIDQILAENGTSSLLDLLKVIEDMESIEVKVVAGKEKRCCQQEFTYSMPVPWSRPATAGKHGMVGFDDELIQLMDVLTGQQSSRQIISITGMGGMDKTTLARNVYENSLITQHFDIRAWATISHEYSVLEILSHLLSRDEISTKIIDELDNLVLFFLMAAYAALVSLMNTMDQIQIHPRLSTCFNKNHIKSLGDAVGFLLDFIESYNDGGRSKEVEDLEGEIACAAHASEDVIESHIVDQILVGSTNSDLEEKIASAAHVTRAANEFTDINRASMQKIGKQFMCNLQKVTKDLDSVRENVIGRLKDQQLTWSTPPPPPPPPTASSRPGKTSMVGFDDYLIHLMDRLTGQQSYKQVIPIIGMGGVGKTTLAINAFQSLLIKQHFDVREWATISQNYSAREILLQLLSSQDESTKFVDLDKHQLGEKLHQYLFNRRYLIVLDDMWSNKVWEEIMSFFPDNINGSRIVVTSRLHDICLHFNSPYLAINLLDKDKSWNLFCQESFGEESCPAELEEVGKKICENCKGLPLSIVVIGGFLRKSNMEQEYWEDVASDTYSVLNSEGNNQCMNILYLSYNHLPAHLKPCFLYMGVFVEDEKILVSRLVKLWVAEGFLRPNDAQSLEEVAQGYLKDLVGRNLILVNRWGSNGKIRACNTHDLIRELCLRVAEKENFLCVMKLVGTPRVLNRERRVVIHESMPNGKVPRDLGSPASLVRSLICRGHRRFNLRLLRVLNVVDEEPFDGFLEADLRCVNLRCTGHQFGRASSNPAYLHIPKKISMLWNLQTVRIEGYLGQVIAPSELWEMVQLRHLKVPQLYVPNPPQNDRAQLVLQNLQTLCNAMNFQLSEEVCMRIPNVKKLSLVYSKSQLGCYAGLYYYSQNLGRFHKLESLTLTFMAKKCRHMVLNVTFPTSLKKLTLRGGDDLYWEDLGMIGTLPNLEVLKLKALQMKGSEWNPGEGEFPRLKFLQIHACQYLSKWNADYIHFPVLEKLVLGLLFDLDEIPSGIGEIPTLQNIRLFLCSVPCALSAMKILQEQESYGNEDLQVEVVFSIHNKKDSDIFREMVEREGFTSNNLHIEVWL